MIASFFIIKISEILIIMEFDEENYECKHYETIENNLELTFFLYPWIYFKKEYRNKLSNFDKKKKVEGIKIRNFLFHSYHE